MTDLRFHQATMNLLPEPPQFSNEAKLLLDRKETEHGIVFPPSVREWYSLEGAEDLLCRYSNQDHPTPLKSLGDPFPNWYGSGQRDFADYGLLHLLCENQGVANWAVRLDDHDDPEVVVAVDSAPTEIWLPHAETFSTFIWTRIWDHTMGDCLLQAQDGPLDRASLEHLRSTFAEQTLTRSWPAQTQYRFSSPAGRVLIWDDEVGQADWWIAAENAHHLAALTRLVWHCGSLKDSLWANEAGPAKVLDEIKAEGK